MASSWRDVAEELRRLWDVDQLDGSALSEHAPSVVERFGFGDAELALSTMRELLTRSIDDKYMGALASAMRMHPEAETGNVLQRFTAYGVTLEPEREQRQVRRYAERGADLFAQVALSVNEFDMDRPLIDLALHYQDDAVKGLLALTAFDEALPICLTIDSNDTRLTISTFEERSLSLELAVGKRIDLSWLTPVAPNLDLHVTGDPLNRVWTTWGGDGVVVTLGESEQPD